MTPKPHQSRSALPSKDEILKFINSQPKKVGKRDIARAFKIKGNSKIGLKRLLREMADEGMIANNRKRLVSSAHLPPVGVLTIKRQNDDGDLVAEPSNWDFDKNPSPPMIVITSAKAKHGNDVAGVGDRVLARIEKVEEGKNTTTYEARVIKRLDKDQSTMLGVFKASPDGSGIIEPIDKKQRREFMVPAGSVGSAETGDLVSVELNRKKAYGPEQVRIKSTLGKIDSHRSASRIAIATYEIPHEFPKDVLKEAEAQKAPALKGRKDLRHVPLITIDPSDARDHDDAVHAESDTASDNPGGFIVTVAIADVAAHVTPGSALDKHAIERGNSVYFPDCVVPMLPERLSNDLCSLRPDEDRPALVCRMVFDAQGNKRGHEFIRAMIKSHAKLSYNQAQDGIDGRADDATKPWVEPVLRPLWQAYEALITAQKKRNPLGLELPERRIVFTSSGDIEAIVMRDRFDAHRLVEEFMIQANVAAAQTLEENKQPLIFRCHDNPSQEKTKGLIEFLKTLELKLPAGEVLRPMHFNRILAQVANSEHESLVHQSVLRAQAQAEYSVANYGHFGLNLKQYAHFTSPIRRYADLVVHRALIATLSKAKSLELAGQDLEEIAEHLSMTERRAAKAERETVDRILSSFLMDKIGAEFSARISGITRSAMFVELTETGADGIIPMSSMHRDRYVANEGLYSLVGLSSGETFKLGDQVTVRLIEAAPVAGALRFELLSEGIYEKPPKGRFVKKPGNKFKKSGSKHRTKSRRQGR